MRTQKFCQLTDNVWYLEFAEETDRPNIGYVCGSKQALLIDAGNSPAHAKSVADCLREYGLMPPAWAAITHWHWDHTFGMCGLRAKTIVSQKTEQQLRRMRRWEWTDEAMQSRLETGEEIEFCDTRMRREYPDTQKIRVKMADTVIAGEKQLDLGGVSCRLLPVDSPHSRDAMLVLIPEEGVLFAGDADCEDFYHGGCYDIDKLAAYIELLKQLEFTYYVPGHWHPCTKQQEIEFLQEKLDALRRQK
ncbi:MAG: MBL fold metallo-hydrolase [Clostridia bacterium]|nr:MBL fold metallo-hydrolase [Clostridia bacterium]